MGWEFDSPYVHMAYIRVGGRAQVVESHVVNGTDYKNWTGRILIVARKYVMLDFGSNRTIKVPLDKVIPV